MRRSATAGWALGVVLVLGTAACAGNGTTGGSGPAASGAATDGAAAPSTSPSPAGPAVAIAPAPGAAGVRLDQPVKVTVDKGTLTDVQVRSAAGARLAGAFDTQKAEWHSTAGMVANTTYTVTVAASDGSTPVTRSATFTTLKPKAVNSARLNIGDDQVVGVGMPIILQFDRPVRNTDAVLKALKVTTSPQVEGAWHWMEPANWVGKNTEVWFRPKEYWPAGTKVSMSADLGSVELSPGVWGKRRYSTKFTVGDAVINTVDVQKHQLTMRRNGAVVKVIPITTGKAGPKWSTRGGIKVITEKRAELRMDSRTLGIKDEADPDFYNEIEHWTLRLTYSGEFLHARPGSEWAFGKQNISHGCTGMSMANAKWLFDHSAVGDVVQYTGSDRKLEPGNGYTAWNMPYEKWAGAAADGSTGTSSTA